MRQRSILLLGALSALLAGCSTEGVLVSDSELESLRSVMAINLVLDQTYGGRYAYNAHVPVERLARKYCSYAGVEVSGDSCPFTLKIVVRGTPLGANYREERNPVLTPSYSYQETGAKIAATVTLTRADGREIFRRSVERTYQPEESFMSVWSEKPPPYSDALNNSDFPKTLVEVVRMIAGEKSLALIIFDEDRDARYHVEDFLRDAHPSWDMWEPNRWVISGGDDFLRKVDSTWRKEEIEQAGVPFFIRLVGHQGFDVEVRGAAAKALGMIGDRRAIDPLVAAISDTSHHVAMAAAEALSQFDDVRLVKPLVQFYRATLRRGTDRYDYLLKIRNRAIIGSLSQDLVDEFLRVKGSLVWSKEWPSPILHLLAELKIERALPYLIQALDDKDLRYSTKEGVAETLKSLTGRGFGTNVESWREWWNTRAK